MSRIGSLGFQLTSILLLVWIIVTGPPAVIALISDLTDWRSVLLEPKEAWEELVYSFSDRVPYLDALGPVGINLLYLLVLFAACAWQYVSSVALEVRRQEKFVSSIAHVKAPPVSENAHRTLPVAGAAVAALFALILVPFAIPIVITHAAIGGVAGGVAQAALTQRDKEVSALYADGETQRIIDEANQRIANFRAKETRKIVIAFVIVALLVAYNFFGYLIYELLRHFAR